MRKIAVNGYLEPVSQMDLNVRSVVEKDTGRFLRAICINRCSCRHQISLTEGTVFHKTRIPLMKWFMLIFRMATSKTGVFINELKRELEIKDYKTVWTMAHKVRTDMADRDSRYKLAGLVEIDESFFGPSFSGKRGRETEKKELGIVAVSTWTNSDGVEIPGFVHAFVVENATANTIENVHIRIGIPSKEFELLTKSIRSEGWRSYQAVAEKCGIVHSRVVLRDPKDSMKLLPWTHRVIANAKAVLLGLIEAYQANIFKDIYQRCVIGLIVDFGDEKFFIGCFMHVLRHIR